MPRFLDNPLDPALSRPNQGFFRLSQGHLSLLSTCPRKFQHIYLDQLGLPTIPEEQQRQVLGTHFHQLRQQQELGLPIENFVQADPHLQRWFEAFTHSPPQMLVGDRQSEHQRSLGFRHYLLTGVYDLLILGQQQAQILDWKTYARPQNPQRLQQNWQTRLYLYLLAETSDYLPEQIFMTYWFAESRGNGAEPHSLSFTYSAALHNQTQKDLEHLLGNLTNWLEAYSRGNLFPQVSLDLGECDGRHNKGHSGSSEASGCRFAIRCQRQGPSQTNIALPTLLDQIQELPL